MGKFSIDYEQLGKELTKPKVFKYAEVKDRLQKVAFDVVRFTDCNDAIDGLWQVQATDDGEVIVALYEEGGDIAKESSDWKAISDKKASEIHVFYKNEPVNVVPVRDIPASEVPDFCNYLPVKLASDKKLQKSLLKDLSASERNSLLAKFPELKD